MKPQNIPKNLRHRVSIKISHLIEEGVPRKKAVAMAMNMARSGKLGIRGGYLRNPRPIKITALSQFHAGLVLKEYADRYEVIDWDKKPLVTLKNGRIHDTGEIDFQGTFLNLYHKTFGKKKRDELENFFLMLAGEK